MVLPAAIVPSLPLFTVLILILSSISAGFIIGFPAPATWQIQQYFELTRSSIALFTALPFLSSVISPFICLYILRFRDVYFLLRLVSVLGIVLWAVLWNANPEDELLPQIHRALSGIAVGVISFVVPHRLTVVGPPEHKLIYEVGHQFGVALGVLLVHVASLLFDWWELSFLGALLFALFLCGTAVIPDQPPGRTFPPPEPQPLSQHNRRTYATCFALVLLRVFTGFVPFLANLHWHGLAGRAAVTSTVALMAGMVAGVRARAAMSRRVQWTVSLGGEALALLALMLALEDAALWMRSLAAAAFFAFAGFGFVPIGQQIQEEDLHSARGNRTASVSLSCADGLLVGAFVYCWPDISEMFGIQRVVACCAMVAVGGAVFGSCMFKTAPETPQPENSRLLESSGQVEEEDGII
jgi:hypothetical protein